MISLCVHVAFLPCEHRERGKLPDVTSYKDTNPIGSGPHPMASFNFNYFHKGPISKHSHAGVRTSAYEFGGDTSIQSIIAVEGGHLSLQVGSYLPVGVL